MHPDVERNVNHLDGLTDLHLSVYATMLQADGGKVFPLDFLAAATIKRSLALIRGFTSMVRDSNYTCAASLLRLQLDSCLRLCAAFIVDDPHALALSVLDGKPIRNFKDRKGNKLTDRHLVNVVAKRFEWAPRVYEATSGFVHLSEKHMFSIFTEPPDGEHTFGLRVGPQDNDVPAELWEELTFGFLAATDALFEYLKGWALTKHKPELAEGATCELDR